MSVAQLVEPQIVVLVVAGSSPVRHPKCEGVYKMITYSLYFHRWIKLYKHITNDEWYFQFCDNFGNLVSPTVYKAKSNYHLFNWTCLN